MLINMSGKQFHQKIPLFTPVFENRNVCWFEYKRMKIELSDSTNNLFFGLALQCFSMHGSAFGIIVQKLLCVLPFPQFCVINCKCHNALWFMFLTLIELFKELLLLSMEKNLPLLKTTFSFPLLHCGVLTKGMLINMSEKLFQYNSSTLFTHLSVTRQFLKKRGLVENI